MSEQRWIVVRNWEKFQHYGNRRPVWVKIYLDLLHNPNWLGLTPSSRAVLLGLWLLYASGRRAVPHSTAYLSRALQMRVDSQQLESLNHAGFIEFVASKPLALNARSREEEKDKDLKTSLQGLKRTPSRAREDHDDEELFADVEKLLRPWPQ